MDSTRMPLEVRVTDRTIAEIYRAQDFFGEYPRLEDGERHDDREIWNELRRDLAEMQSLPEQSVPGMARLLGSLGTVSGIFLLWAPALH